MPPTPRPAAPGTRVPAPSVPATSAPASTWTGPDVPRGAVVVAVDGGPGDHAALRWAEAQALATSRPLHLVHALADEVATVVDASGTVVMGDGAALAQRAAAARARARALAAELAPGAGVSVVTGHVVTRLQAASRGAHLMVLGDTLLRAAPGRPGQQVAVFLAMRARCPVVVVPRGADAPAADHAAADHAAGAGAAAHGGAAAPGAVMPPRGSAERTAVVVGVDGTHAGRGALALAFAQASARGAQLKVVHVWPPSGPDGAAGAAGAAPDGPPGAPQDDGWTERRAMVSELLAGFRERYPDVLVVTHLIRGEPVAGLVGRSWRADLVVLSGCYGEGRLGLLPGEVTLGVLEQARCPVAMVRDGGVGDHLRGLAPRTLRAAGEHAPAARDGGVLSGT